MSVELKFHSPDKVGLFELGAPIDSLLLEVSLLKVPPTESELIDGIQPYSASVGGSEIALLDVRAGLISAITTFTSFVVGDEEMIGNELSALESAVGESYHDVTRVEHDDGSVVDYYDYPDNRLIVTTENEQISSVCVFSAGLQ